MTLLEMLETRARLHGHHSVKAERFARDAHALRAVVAAMLIQEDTPRCFLQPTRLDFCD